MIIYHNPRCSKSRQTIELLKKEGISFTIIEYLTDTPDTSELKSILKKLGIKAEQLLRKNEAVFKEKFKGEKLSEDEWIAAMIENPKLIERPIVVHENKAVIGRPPENINSLL